MGSGPVKDDGGAEKPVAPAPLSPFGNLLRRILYTASALIPVVWSAAFAAFWLLGNRSTFVGAGGGGEVLLAVVLIVAWLYLPLVLVAWLSFVVFFKLRAYLLEMMLILCVVSLPPGFWLASMNPELDLWQRLLSFCGMLCVSVCLLGTGSVWGLSVSQRYGEERTWARLGYIVLGWAMLVGFVAAGTLAISICNLFRAQVEQDIKEAWLLIVVSSFPAAASVYGLLVERRCRKRHGPVRV